jgi:hypothetical protein
LYEVDTGGWEFDLEHIGVRPLKLEHDLPHAIQDPELVNCTWALEANPSIAKDANF